MQPLRKASDISFDLHNLTNQGGRTRSSAAGEGARSWGSGGWGSGRGWGTRLRHTNPHIQIALLCRRRRALPFWNAVLEALLV